jgi:cytochrome c556
MKRLLLILAAGVVVACWLASTVHSQKPAADVKDFMRAKLMHMEKVLEGVTTEDYDLIRKNANQLTLLSHAASWRVLETPAYRDYSAEFRRSTEAIVEAAKKKNLDGAALAYVDTTMKCVTCHKYVRSVRMARFDTPPRDTLLGLRELTPSLTALPE